ncbi:MULTISPECIES: molecular chaperone [Desulfitobacterium]|uniref:Putative component of anaerobic dehydrogenase n=1 Tax=Desulfitobacterium dehalogenans (strain ATCC 51507 / DSM 9161 / JW/IU-DC1) TaxID=756499 RepID=I4A7A2_DESDJ|nr:MULTISPECIES: molecular chaperone TorD family protein [Desulfitobacterium]AFL99836.1 putative component of anaerobic dehydrogenase [Desulfitobacterium dehalogenans ATCC 51507]
MNNTCPSPQALQDLLRLFAEFFAFPDEDFCEAVRGGSVDLQVKELSQRAGVPIESELEKDALSYEEWVTSYNRCFLGVQKPFAPPIESIYKPWTTDESFQVPFKNQKGYLMGDSAQHVQHILKSFGLEIPQEYTMMPDHLVILLELLAFLVGSGFEKEAKQLCQDHFDWLPDLQKAIEELPANGRIFIAALRELEDILQAFMSHARNHRLLKETIDYSNF